METHLKKKNVNTSNGKHYHIKVYDDEDMAMDKVVNGKDGKEYTFKQENKLNWDSMKAKNQA